MGRASALGCIPRKLTDSRWVRWVRSLLACLGRLRTLGLAAETAFWLFLALVPLAAMGGVVAAKLSLHNWDRLAPVLDTLPTSTRALIVSEMSQVSRWDAGTVGIVGGLSFVWLGSSGIHSIFSALELETDCQRSWFMTRGLAVATSILLSLGMLLLAVLGPGLEAVLGWVGGAIPALANVWWRAARGLVALLVLFGHTYVFYWIGVPAPARRRMPLVPGAVVAVLLQVSMGFGYALYLGHLGEGPAYGAGLAVIGAALTALYLYSLALLIGAVINRQLAAARGRGDR